MMALFRKKTENETKTTAVEIAHQADLRKRRMDRYKRDMYSLAEQQVKQNEVIIGLLTEIRDRLPAKK